MTPAKREIIVVRSLAESDLGLFATQRSSAKSKQRAININSDVARRLLSPLVFKTGGIDLKCICVFQGTFTCERRRFGKSGKNWRLGGRKIEGSAFAGLDSKDLMIMRTTEGNDGTRPVTLVFISKRNQRILHAGIAAVFGHQLDGSMVVVDEADKQFKDLSIVCPAMIWPDPGPEPLSAGSQGRLAL